MSNEIAVFWNYKTINQQVYIKVFCVTLFFVHFFSRSPQPADAWYSEHQRTCGGNFIKIAEPDKKQTKVKRGPLDDYVTRSQK